jgi:stage III sporulation protein AG
MDDIFYENASAHEKADTPEKTSFGLPFKLKKDNFLIMILVGILLLVIVWPMGGSDKEGEVSEEQNTLFGAEGSYGEEETVLYTASGTETEEEMLSYAAYLEKELEEVLSSMEGAGRVKVLITLESSKEAVLEKDVVKQRAGTTEVDSAGGSRNTTDISQQEETVYTDGQSSLKTPYVKRIDAPKVQGVLVSAEGGQNTRVVKNITEAIQALFGIEAHKIKIVKMNSQ